MVFESLTANIPTWEIITIVILFVLFLIAGSIVAFILINRYRWPFTVAILENTAGTGYVVSKRDKARLIKFGDGGEEIFLLKRLKLYRIGYGKRIGRNYIAFAIDNSGYWNNVTFGDINKKLSELGVTPVDRDLRFANSSLRKGIENRYNEKTFFEKWGVTITIIMLIIAMIVGGIVLYISFDKQIEMASINAEGMKVAKEVAELQKQLLSNIDIIKEGGSGSGLTSG